MSLQSRVFPDNPFLHTYAIIMITDGLVMLAAIIVSIWQDNWLWCAAGLLLSIVVFVLLNKKCLRQLSCPQCHKHVTFEAGKGFTCKKCNVGWVLG